MSADSWLFKCCLLLTIAMLSSFQESGTGKRKVIKALMRIPQDTRVKEKMSKWTKEQKSKFIYLRDKFGRSSSKRFQGRQTRCLMRQRSDPVLLPSQCEERELALSIPNGISPTELAKIVPSPSRPSWMHQVVLPRSNTE